MTGEAMTPMELIGMVGRVSYYWAEPGRFLEPGVYRWDPAVSKNELLVPAGPNWQHVCQVKHDFKYVRASDEHWVECTPAQAIDMLREVLGIDVRVSDPPAPTPGANWRKAGEADPFGDRYDTERAALPMGKLTDDELANEAYMNFDQRPTIEQLKAGTHFTPMMWMDAVKNRIRWLSRALERAKKGL